MVSLDLSNNPSDSDGSHETKQKILSAAKNEFAQYGFEGARMQRLANRAAIPKPNIHYHFKTKQHRKNKHRTLLSCKTFKSVLYVDLFHYQIH